MCSRPTWALLLVAALCVAASRPAGAEPPPQFEARNPSETYERKESLEECLSYATGELAARWRAAGIEVPAELLLVVDGTPSLAGHIRVLRHLLPGLWESGPPGLRIGLLVPALDRYVEPTRLPGEVAGGLDVLLLAPGRGAPNLLAALRGAAERFGSGEGQPRSIVLISREHGEGEDDVEATRQALLATGASLYCVAGEAALERSWMRSVHERRPMSGGLKERFVPEAERGVPGTLYLGGEAAIGLIPYDWEFNLAQTTFVWTGLPPYPVPSGFGYWPLASLCHATGGRYFIFDFSTAPAGRSPRAGTPATLYNTSRLGLLAPDLRPRHRILKDLAGDKRAQAIVRIWSLLAGESLPILQRRPPLERKGSRLVTRADSPIAARAPLPPVCETAADVRRLKEGVRQRLQRVAEAHGIWSSVLAEMPPGNAAERPLLERVEADFLLLGVQLEKVQFHWAEYLAAVDSIEPVDLRFRRAIIRPRVLLQGVDLPPGRRLDRGDRERHMRLLHLLMALRTFADRYDGTPWALLLRKGRVLTFEKHVEVIPRQRGRSAPGPGKPPPPQKPPPKPPPGPRPGSGGTGPVTGD